MNNLTLCKMVSNKMLPFITLTNKIPKIVIKNVFDSHMQSYTFISITVVFYSHF